MGRVPWMPAAAGADPAPAAGLKQPPLSTHVFPLRIQCLGLPGLAPAWCFSLAMTSEKKHLTDSPIKTTCNGGEVIFQKQIKELFLPRKREVDAELP